MGTYIFTDKEKAEKIIEATGISKTEMAKRLGVSYRTVHRWLSENVTPHPVQAQEIDELFKEYVDMRGLVVDIRKKIKDPVETLKNTPEIRDKFFLEMTYNSNAIEGSRMTMNETELIFEGKIVKNKEMFEIFEVINHKNALMFVMENICPDFKITEEYILKLHEIVMYNFSNKLPGKYRTGYVNLTNTEIALPSAQDVPLRMGKLIKNINKYGSDVVGKIAKDHCEFEAIHPFFDGNGRIGRLLSITQCLSRGLPPAMIKVDDRNKYYVALGKADYGDIEYATQFFCEAILDGANLLTATASSLRA